MKIYIISIIWALLAAGCTTDKVAGTLPAGDSGAGDNLTPGDTPPVLIQTVLPGYPYELQRKGIEGKVVVEFFVDSGGKVVSARAISSPNKLFSDSAVAAVRQFVFLPATRQGRPVNARMRTPIEFHLDPKTANPPPPSGSPAVSAPAAPLPGAAGLQR